MKNLLPKHVFTLLNSKPNGEIQEICITLKDTHGAISEVANVLSKGIVDIRASILFETVELKCLVNGDDLCEFEVKPN